MPKAIIADTSCLIVLSKIGELTLLARIYGQITTTPVIAKEYGEELPDWVTVLEPADPSKQRVLELHLDRGEASAIALAMELAASTLILDDQKARKVAERLGLSYTGTIGVLIKAKRSGHLPALAPILEKIVSSGFHLSDALRTAALREAGE
ncbi:MAG TPA: DUF3368 domain-containing protein [Flavobacteriales bacterium]|nr:DUF3368 domain-containing protein [Flavobacteriales bacterium]